MHSDCDDFCAQKPQIWFIVNDSQYSTDPKLELTVTQMLAYVWFSYIYVFVWFSYKNTSEKKHKIHQNSTISYWCIYYFCVYVCIDIESKKKQHNFQFRRFEFHILLHLLCVVLCHKFFKEKKHAYRHHTIICNRFILPI